MNNYAYCFCFAFLSLLLLYFDCLLDWEFGLEVKWAKITQLGWRFLHVHRQILIKTQRIYLTSSLKKRDVYRFCIVIKQKINGFTMKLLWLIIVFNDSFSEKQKMILHFLYLDFLRNTKCFIISSPPLELWSEDAPAVGVTSSKGWSDTRAYMGTTDIAKASRCIIGGTVHNIIRFGFAAKPITKHHRAALISLQRKVYNL